VTPYNFSIIFFIISLSATPFAETVLCRKNCVDIVSGYPGIFVAIFVPFVVVYQRNFVLSTLVGKWFFKSDDAIAVSYIIQVQTAAWYVRFTDTIFGPV